MMKLELSKRLIKIKYENVFFYIDSFIYYKTQAEMCYKWILLLQQILRSRLSTIIQKTSPLIYSSPAAARLPLLRLGRRLINTFKTYLRKSDEILLYLRLFIGDLTAFPIPMHHCALVDQEIV